ncbi:MAG: hypothetical protein FWH15_04385 [Betaproteobacteria bacterium]|nr:hypothetical protein [Betaproteobacteria bacterium]
MATDIETIDTKIKHLRAQKAKLLARETHKKRARDTRRKVIAGTIFLKWAEQDSQLRQRLLAAIPEKEKKLFMDGTGKL